MEHRDGFDAHGHRGAAVSSTLHGVGTVSRIQTMRRSKNDAQPLHVLAIAMPISHITR
jgi:hypothetical protein